MPFNAPQPTRPSQTPAHTAVRADTREGRAPIAAALCHAIFAASASIRACAYASALPVYRVHAYTALPTGAYARAQKPRRMAATSTIAGKGTHVPAYAGCISRLLAPKVARPSRRPRSALQLHAPASRRVPHSVSQPTPPQGMSAPAADPRRHGLSNSVAPAARKRSASAATGACYAVTLRTAPSPLRSLALPPRSFRGLRKPPSGSCSAGREEREERTIHARQPALLHIRSRIC